MKKIPKSAYTSEFKAQAVKHAQAIGLSRASRELGVVKQTLRNWLKAAAAGKIGQTSAPPLPVADNLLDRNFAPTAANRVWTSDITYISTNEGWLYLAVVMDLFNRQIIGWSIKPRMKADIVTDALHMAWLKRRPAAGVLFHSDRARQYASHAVSAKLAEYGMVASMSRKGCAGIMHPPRVSSTA